MSILNQDIKQITTNTGRNIHMFETIEYCDPTGSWQCVVLDMDDDFNPTLIGRLIFVAGRRHYGWEWDSDEIKNTNMGNSDLRSYYKNKWVLPSITWFEKYFGRTNIEKWNSPSYNKFRHNLLKPLGRSAPSTHCDMWTSTIYDSKERWVFKLDSPTAYWTNDPEVIDEIPNFEPYDDKDETCYVMLIKKINS